MPYLLDLRLDWQQLLSSIAGTLALYGVYQIIKLVYASWTNPLRDLPGPKNASWFYGNLKDIWQADNSVLHEKWVEEYGLTMKYRGLLSSTRLFTMDTKAINHILMNSNDYQKSKASRSGLGRIVGPGVLVVEGEEHKLQRKIMNPAFGPAQVRELTEIFLDKAIQLRDVWASESAKENGTGHIEVLSWLGRMTLDVIGLAGFNYKFDSLNTEGPQNELSQAFSAVFHAGTRVSVLPLLQNWFPILRYLPTARNKKIMESHKTMSRIGNQLLRESKASIIGTGSKPMEKSKVQGRDLLTLLVKSNMTTTDSQRLSDEDVLAQVPTFLVAGHETTSTATTWALFALTQNPEVQTKLRNELLAFPSDRPTMDDLNSFPYLDFVVRETLRLHTPVPMTSRIAMKDDIVPLKTPFVDKKGVTQHSIRINKGQEMVIPILALNRSKSLWGEDAMEFKPERWESVPETVTSIPGVWGSILTFLGGPRSCIGYRFSLVEMKALLFTLVRAFEFELDADPKDIVKKTFIVQRPVLLTDPEGGNQMPLVVRPYRGS